MLFLSLTLSDLACNGDDSETDVADTDTDADADTDTDTDTDTDADTDADTDTDINPEDCPSLSPNDCKLAEGVCAVITGEEVLSDEMGGWCVGKAEAIGCRNPADACPPGPDWGETAQAPDVCFLFRDGCALPGSVDCSDVAMQVTNLCQP
jgi:hypothetical protein